MNRRRFLRALSVSLLALLAVPLAATAQQPEKTYRVAYLAAAPRSGNQALLTRFQEGMRELGYVEGRNLVLEATTATIPIVFVAVVDPVGAGLIPN